MKRIRIKKPKPKSNRMLLRQWGKEVREQWGNKCAVCGQTTHCQAHHILPKKKYVEHKFDHRIGICLCPGCHKFHSESAESNAIWFSEWLKLNHPEIWLYAYNIIFQKEIK